MQDLVIRQARLDDSGQVWPLARDFATSFEPARESFDPTFQRLLRASNALFVVATVGGIVRGYLAAHVHHTFLANGPITWIEEVMVKESHRRLGIGRALIDEAELWSASVGGIYISLASRRARAFYLALGYDESATFFKKALPRSR